MIIEHLHLSDEALEELVDGMASGEARRSAGRHLASCARCAARVRALETTGELLRSLPIEQAGDGFTRSVLAQIDEGGSARALSLAGWLAGIFGLVIVGGALVTIFAVTGVIHVPDAGDLAPTAKRYLGEGWEAVTAALLPVGKWVSQRVPTHGTMTTTYLTLGVIVLLGAFDRLVGRRFLRGHQSV